MNNIKNHIDMKTLLNRIGVCGTQAAGQNTMSNTNTPRSAREMQSNNGWQVDDRVMSSESPTNYLLFTYYSPTIVSMQSAAIKAVKRAYMSACRYAAMLLMVFVMGVGQAWGDYKPYLAEGFEGTITLSGSSCTASNSNATANGTARTGSKVCYAYPSSASSSARYVGVGSNLTADKNWYIHAIVWVKGDNVANSKVQHQIGPYGTSPATAYVNTTTSYTRCTITPLKSGGSAKQIRLYFISNNGTPVAHFWYDDFIMYLSSENVATDLTKPSQATAASATTSSISWTNGSDTGTGATGIQNTLIWRRSSGSDNDLTLNDQGIYSLTSTQGPSTDQSGHWTLVSASVAAGATSYSGTFAAGAVYAIVHRDLAYNYSTPTYVTVAGGGCDATAPGDISKGTPSAGTLRLTSSGSPASGDTWYWQTSADGTSKSESGATKDVSAAGTYYIRSYNTSGDCWSTAKSVTVAAGDLLTAISPSLSYSPSTLVLTVLTSTTPTLTGNTGSGTVRYSSSNTSVATVNESTGVVTAVAAGTTTITASIAANGGYAAGEATATIKVAAAPLGIIDQKLATGSVAWDASTIVTSDYTNITSLTALSQHGSATASGNGNASNGGQTSKIGTASGDFNASNYLELSFNVKSGKQLNVSSISIPVQPVTSNTNNFKAVLSDGVTNIEGTKTNITNGTLENITFASYGVVKGTVTLRIYAWGWTAGYRLGTNIIIDGTIEDEVACVAPSSVGISGTSSYLPGQTISLTAAATSGTGTTTTYQWYHRGVAISGATSNTYSKANCTIADAGNYTCKVTKDGSCSTTSPNFAVRVYSVKIWSSGGGSEIGNYPLAYVSSNTGRATVSTLSASTTYEFKVIDNVGGSPDSTIYYGNTGTIHHNTSIDPAAWDFGASTSNNCKIITGVATGNFIFDVDITHNGTGTGYYVNVNVAYPTKTIYLTPGLWNADGAKFAIYYWDGNSGTGWTDFITPNDCGMSVDIPVWDGGKMKAVRLSSSTVAPGSFDDAWNQSGDFTISNSYNSIVVYAFDNITYNSTFSVPTYTISYAKGSTTATGGAAISGSKASETKTCGVDFTLPSSAVFTATGYTQVGWSTTDGGAQTHALGGSYTTNAAQTFYPVWEQDAVLTALECNTLYEVDDMVPSTITLTTTGQYAAGLSSNTKFEVLGDPLKTDQSGGTPEMKNISEVTIDGTGFEAAMYLKRAAVLSSSLPTSHAVKFIVGSSGKLTMYVKRSDRLFLIKDGGEAQSLGSSDKDVKVDMDVDAGTYYIYATNTNTAIYGIKLNCCTTPAVPTAFTAGSITTDGVTFSITDAGDAASYDIYYSTSSTAPSAGTAATTTSDSKSKTISGLSDNTTYYAWVRSVCDATHKSAWVALSGSSFKTEAIVLYTITYNANGGTCGTASATQASAGASLTLPTPTLSGYTFQGWYVTDGTKAGNAGATYTPEADITLHAKWYETCAGGASVATFNFNDGESTGLTIEKTNASWTYSLVNSKTDEIPILEGYNLHMSFLSSSTGQLTITTDNSYSSIDSIKFNSASTDNSNPKVAIFTVAGTPETETSRLSAIAVSSGTTKTWRATPYKLDLSKTKPTGKVRFKFTTSSSGKYAGIDNIQIYYSGGGGSCYHVTYLANTATTGFVSDPTSYSSGETATVLSNGGTYPYAKAGNTFVSWNTAADGSGTTYAPGSEIEMTSDVTLYAQWSAGPVTTYNVTYHDNDADGGSVPTDAVDYPSGSTVTVKGNTGLLTKEFMSFNGWNTVADGSGIRYTGGATFSITSDVDLYAQWEEVSCDGVNFSTEAAVESGSLTVGNGTEIEITSSSYTTTSGGRIFVGSTKSDGTESLTVFRSGPLFNFGTNRMYLKLQLSTSLKAGDLIQATGLNSTYQLALTTSAVYSTDITTTSGEYEIAADDDLVGATTIYVWRAEGSTTHLSSLTIDGDNTISTAVITPASPSVEKDYDLTLTCTAGGATSYQWYNASTDAAILGATSSTYSPSTASIGASSFYCIASNNCMELKSTTATVTVTAAKSAPTFTWKVDGSAATWNATEGYWEYTVNSGGWNEISTTETVAAYDGVLDMSLSTSTGASLGVTTTEGKTVTGRLTLSSSAPTKVILRATATETTTYRSGSSELHLTVSQCVRCIGQSKYSDR